MENRANALKNHLELETLEEAEELIENEDYLVLTDDEADEKAKEYIKESLWAFRAEFILNHMKADYSDDLLKSIQVIQELCEGANDVIGAVIEDIDEFIDDAISADGRGHFISFYDGYESEEHYKNKTYYIYRQN